MTSDMLNASSKVAGRSVSFASQFKRAFDIGVSSFAFTLLSPILAIIVLAILLTSPGPVLYHGTRVGRYGRSFKVHKFRSMVVNADKAGPVVTVQNDPRITRVGRILRKTKMDELPQLVNVIRGDMSLVGPRPETPEYVRYYTPEQKLLILSVRPGITSPASVAFRHEEEMLSGADWEQQYVDSIMPAKLALDGEYALKPTIMKDIKILLQTVAVLFR